MTDQRRRSETFFQESGVAGFQHRAFTKAMGFDDTDMDHPVIGICNTWSELNNCNGNLRELAEAVKPGGWQAQPSAGEVTSTGGSVGKTGLRFGLVVTSATVGRWWMRLASLPARPSSHALPSITTPGPHNAASHPPMLRVDPTSFRPYAATGQVKSIRRDRSY